MGQKSKRNKTKSGKKRPSNSEGPPLNSSNNNSDVFFTAALELHKEGCRLVLAEQYEAALTNFTSTMNTMKLLCVDDNLMKTLFVPDLHSCRAACLLKIDPVDYKLAIKECELSVQLNPDNRSVMALLEEAKKGLIIDADSHGEFDSACLRQGCSGSCDFSSDIDDEEETYNSLQPGRSTEITDLHMSSHDIDPVCLSDHQSPDKPFFEESAQMAWKAYIEELQSPMPAPSAYDVSQPQETITMQQLMAMYKPVPGYSGSGLYYSVLP